ncbi:MAG: hypothetical protein HY077_17130 [Elusimicrobia bacterium]|nr:hypothetical protein [Elusimicrobiota bacterium]
MEDRRPQQRRGIEGGRTDHDMPVRIRSTIVLSRHSFIKGRASGRFPSDKGWNTERLAARGSADNLSRRRSINAVGLLRETDRARRYLSDAPLSVKKFARRLRIGFLIAAWEIGESLVDVQVEPASFLQLVSDLSLGNDPQRRVGDHRPIAGAIRFTQTNSLLYVEDCIIDRFEIILDDPLALVDHALQIIQIGFLGGI